MNVIEDLLALQSHDEIIRNLEGPIADIPERCGQEQKKIAAEEAFLAKAADEVKRLVLLARDNELEIARIKERIQKIKIDSATVKKAEAFNAIKKELDEAERALAALVEKDTDDNMLLEGAQKYSAECAAKVEEVKSVVNAYVSELEAKLAGLQAKYEQAMAERKELLARIDTPATRRFLAHYERLKTKRWPVLIEVNPGSACSGCHMSLPPSKFQEAIKNTKLKDDPAKMAVVACDYCGRMLYR